MLSRSICLDDSAIARPSTEGNGVVQVPQKRPRPTLSCLECRRKKLRCDRLLPCRQCQKAGNTARCTYTKSQGSQPPAQLSDESEYGSGGRSKKATRSKSRVRPHGSSSSSRFPTNTGSVGRENTRAIEDLQLRVEKLERLLLDQRHHSLPSQKAASGRDEQVDRSSISHLGKLSINGSRSRYHGHNHKKLWLHQFDEARDFIQRSSRDPSMTAMMNEFSQSQKAFRERYEIVNSKILLDHFAAFSKMLEILPSRDVCDDLVEIYFSNFEKTLRILHAPTFLTECRHFWTSREAQTSVSSDFLPQLVTVLAIASSLEDRSGQRNRILKKPLFATTFYGLVHAWRDSLDRKRLIELSTLRTQCLLLLARQTVFTQTDEMWNATGILVRSAMTMGLHRDPAEYPDVSIFQGEMRRRLWMTIAEMDLQASLIYGMPTMLRETGFSYVLPANTDDADLVEDMAEYPVSKPVDQWTDSSYQINLARSLPHRLETLNLSGNVTLKADYEKVLRLGTKLEEFLHDIPTTLSVNYSLAEGKCLPGQLFACVMLGVHIRRSLLCLYRPFAMKAAEDRAFHEARRACIQSSLTILSYQDIFQPSIADLEVCNSKKYWDLFHIFCNNDVIQAAFNLCWEIKLMGTSDTPTQNSRIVPEVPPTYPQMQSVLADPTAITVTWTSSSLMSTVENILSSLLRRIIEFGSDLKDPFCLSIVIQSVRTSRSETSERRHKLMHDGAVTVLEACRQHLHKDEIACEQHTNDLSGPEVPLDSSSRPGFDFGGYADPAGQAVDLNGHPLLADLDIFASTDINYDEFQFGIAVNWDLDHAWQ